MWPYRSSAFAASSNQWCTALLIVESVMTLFVVGSGDGSGVAKQLSSRSTMSPDPSFLQCQRPFVPFPKTQFCRGLNLPSMYPAQVAQLFCKCQVPPPQETPSGKTTLPSTVWASVGCGAEGLGVGRGVGSCEGAGACGAMSESPHHSALLQLSQLSRENEHQSTFAAGWSQSPQLSPDELQKQQPSKGSLVGSGVGSGVSTQSPPSSS